MPKQTPACPCTGTTFLFNELIVRHPRILSQRVLVPDIKNPKQTKHRVTRFPDSNRMGIIPDKGSLVGISLGSSKGSEGLSTVAERQAPPTVSDPPPESPRHTGPKLRLIPIKEPHYFDRATLGSFQEYIGKFEPSRWVHGSGPVGQAQCFG